MKHCKIKVLFLISIIAIFVFSIYVVENNLIISYKYYNPFIQDEQVSTKTKYVIPGGQTIGVELKTKGILVVGLADVVNDNKITTSPANDAGIRIGDKIIAVDSIPIATTNDFVFYVAKQGIKEYNLEIERNGNRIQILLMPVKRYDSNDIIFGFWARDNIAGIGAITYIDPETNSYSAVAHGITDADTGDLIDIDFGAISKASITNIKTGKKGNPGEIVGFILRDEGKLGDVKQNTCYGIKGTLNEKGMNYFTNDLIEVGDRDEIQPGPAKILSNIDDKIKEYDIEIVKLYYQGRPSDKSLVIKIVDTELLSLTNGIIQGMSGCPIIQNGKLVGAVTHVFVNDPTRGYGVYIEWLIDEKTQNKSNL
ncbi:SpoIVB peptidase [Sedimentibacter sp. zth1]|uniref:SpoIVB peptidase n=1 Tax=Sedimentibacter sp. zth1 TaxID=2816908 RepID=UPI001A924BCB|nr:SpoIVB peptidase [Sedimentibacter sp. zth1]QSX06811.1 SpoIVB peptidase [Sedimentibacter sp. zth1]